MRDTPIVTFINKLDREIRDPIEVLDEIEDILQIQCAPMNWPIGMGREFKGIYDLVEDRIVVYHQGQGHNVYDYEVIQGLDSDAARALLQTDYDDFCEEIELVKGASHSFDLQDFQTATLTPVYFGTALANFGVKEMLQGFVEHAPGPKAREAEQREVQPDEDKFSGFVFKIQANMDPKHRDRIAFLRVCSGRYEQGMKLKHLRLGKIVKITDAVTFKRFAQRKGINCKPTSIVLDTDCSRAWYRIDQMWRNAYLGTQRLPKLSFITFLRAKVH